MKNLYIFLILIFSVFAGKAQILNIPDSNFKAKLLYSSPSAGIGKDQFGNNITIDTNHNGEIEFSEALTVYGLSVSNGTISDLTGLENFSNLTDFNCSVNNLTNISIVNTLPNLQTLYCAFNSLTDLDLSANPIMETIFCNENNLTSLEIGNCLNLKNLSCSYNQLSTLATSNMHNLESLACANNLLSEIHITNNANLYELNCSHNSITELDLTGVGRPLEVTGTNNFFLDCSFNNLSTLDTTVMTPGVIPRIECGVNPNMISIFAKNGGVFMDDNPHTPPFPGLYFAGMPNLQYICVDEFNFQYVQDKVTLQGYTNVTVDSACSLSNPSNEIANGFSLYPNPARTILNLHHKAMQDIKSIQVYNLLQQMVFNSNNDVNYIDISGLAVGTYFIKIETDKGFYKSKFIKQ